MLTSFQFPRTQDPSWKKLLSSQSFIQIRDSRNKFPCSYTSPPLSSHFMYIHEAPYNPLMHTPVKASHTPNVSESLLIASYTISRLAGHRLCPAPEGEDALSGPGSAMLPVGSPSSREKASCYCCSILPPRSFPIGTNSHFSFTLIFTPIPSFISKVSL